MDTLEISHVIENFDSLSLEEKEYTFLLIEKNLAETKREELIGRVKEAQIHYQSGNFKEGSLVDLMKDLEDD